jgi:hypothetical protein
MMKTLFRLCFPALAAGLVLDSLIGCVMAGDGDSLIANRLALRSPDGKIEVAISAGGALSYAVNVDGQPGRFKADPKAARVQGTGAAELALFVIYDSPLCCVCDHPRHYLNQPGSTADRPNRS